MNAILTFPMPMDGKLDQIQALPSEDDDERDGRDAAGSACAS